jgi:hypothetical protein
MYSRLADILIPSGRRYKQKIESLYLFYYSFDEIYYPILEEDYANNSYENEKKFLKYQISQLLFPPFPLLFSLFLSLFRDNFLCFDVPGLLLFLLLWSHGTEEADAHDKRTDPDDLSLIAFRHMDWVLIAL